MVEVYGYLLNKEERRSIKYNPKSPAITFMYTDEKYVYNHKAKKIAMLLILSDLVKRVAFEIDEKQLFEESGRIAYEHDVMEIDDMKTFGKEVLLEQAMIAIVSNWESYFSSIFRRMFNDDGFIQWNLDQKEKFEKFLNEFRLFSDFQKIVILNKNKFDSLHFGTYIIENKKINFQHLKAIKSLLKLLDIDIVGLSNDWTEIDKLFEVRHVLVHAPTDSTEDNQKFNRETEQGKKRISDVYTKIEIEKVMKDMANMIDKIDMKLFRRYDTKYIEMNNGS